MTPEEKYKSELSYLEKSIIEEKINILSDVISENLNNNLSHYNVDLEKELNILKQFL